MKNTWILILIIAFGCSSKVKNKYPTKEAVVGSVKPVRLTFDTTQLFLTDYFLTPDSIDSIVCPQGLAHQKINTNDFLIGGIDDELNNLKIYYSGFRYDIPIKKTTDNKINFTFIPKNKNPKTIQLKGTMNDWTGSKNELTEKNGIWKTMLSAKDGKHEYVLVIDGIDQTDPSNSDSINNGMGNYNSVLRVGNPKIPLEMFSNKVENNKILIWHNGVTKVAAYWQNHLIDAEFITITPELLSIQIPIEAKNHEKSVIKIYGISENGFANDLYIPLRKNIPVANASTLARTDKHNMIMYFMMVDRFKNGNPQNDQPLNHPEVHPKADYYGGDLNGVTQQINNKYFSDLGVNTVWLSPITQNPTTPYGQYPNPPTKFSGYHGYWPISSSKVDFRFGTDDEFKTLVDDAHTKNLNVLVDYVANHVHEEHPVYKQHPDWVTDLYLPDGTLNTEKWDEHRLTTWFDVFMPSFNFFKPEVIDAMTDSALFWFKNYPIDGFRHDATKHIPNEFWRTLTYKIKSQISVPQKREIYQIGETYGSTDLINSYVNSGLLDGQFDFNVYDASVAAFAQPNYSFKALSNKLIQSLSNYGYHNLMGYISGNQDRARFISYADGSLDFKEDTKLAGWTRSIEIRDTIGYKKLVMLQAFNMTIPGIPVIYYGDEFGSPGGNDPDNRRMMIFKGLNKHQTWTKKQVTDLCKTRSSNLALIYGDLSLIQADETLLIYARKYFDNEIIVVFNKSDKAQSITLSKPNYLTSKTFKNHNNTNSFTWNQDLSIPPSSFFLFVNN